MIVNDRTDELSVQPQVADNVDRKIKITKFGGIPQVHEVRVSTSLNVSKWGDFHERERKNPILGLCQRLAVLTIKYGKIIEYSRCDKPKRFMMMIGRYLRPEVSKKLINMKSHDYLRLECMWQAIGQTVLLNPDFDPMLIDYDLIKSISKFKIWFLNTVLSTSNDMLALSNMGKDLKQVSSWFQWYALDNRENPLPKPIIRFPGNRQGQPPVFAWFGGHLSHFKVIYSPISDHMICCLCQIRTFGRALPCPPKSMVEEGLKETLTILNEERHVPENVLRDIRYGMTVLSRKLGFSQLTRETHLSTSISGSLEHVQEEGGMALDVKGYLDPFTIPWTALHLLDRSPFCDDSIFESIYEPNAGVNRGSAIYDCYGKQILGQAGRYYSWELRAIDMLYGTNESIQDERHLRRSDDRFKTYYGSHTGDILLLASSGKMLEYGSYEPSPDNYLVVPGFGNIPIWYKKTNTVFVPTKNIPCRVIALGEPGFKVRPLTAGFAALILILKSMRQMVQILLAKDGRCRIGLTTTNKMWSFLKFWGDKPLNPTVFGQSSDYKSATDFIPLSVVQTIWQVFTSYLPFDHPFRVFSALIWAPRELRVDGKQYPNIGNYLWLHKTGSFMGEPMSYMTLTIMNLLSEVISEYYYTLNKPLFSGLSQTDWLRDIPIGIFIIAGDDKLALRYSKHRANLSREASIGLGFVMSTKDGDSDRLMIFCEDHILLKREGVNKRMVYIDVIKGRLLTNVNRPHADNRASIFGKGRMLSNSLDYLDESLRRYVLTCHMNLFIRTHHRGFLNQQLPWFLPPNCGGMGLEPIDIPVWGYKYINYIFEILSNTDWKMRTSLIWQFRRLSDRLHHGVSPTNLAWEKATTALNTLEFSNVGFDPENPGLIFSPEDIANHMSACSVPFTELSPRSYTWDDIKTYAWAHNCVPLDEIIDQFERIDCFQQMLDNPAKIARRTVTNWSRRSSKFWKKLNMTLRHDEVLHQDFKSLKDLETRVSRHTVGFCSINIKDLMCKAGPSLRVCPQPAKIEKFSQKVAQLGALFGKRQINLEIYSKSNRSVTGPDNTGTPNHFGRDEPALTHE